MAKVQLKTILNRSGELSNVLTTIAETLGNFTVEDEKNQLLFGNCTEVQHTFSIVANGEVAGYVRGNATTKAVADLLQVLLAKEMEKKKLGQEVLNLYREINLIFNFSEKLAQTIDAGSICDITLNEARQIINCTNGVIILYDDDARRMQVMASFGELFFEEDTINNRLSQLLKIILGGQSEIVTDTTALKNDGIITAEINYLIYSALKVNHRIMGAIIMATTGSEQYTAADLKLLTTLALQSSAAIESALLYEKNIREAKKREEAIRVVYEATERFVPYQFIDALGHNVITDVKLGDQVEKIVTVLFCDIRDYTTLSEQMTPEENFRFICSFNEKLGPAIRKNRGFINQYLGDAIMAIFPHSPSDALQAAIQMQKTVSELNDLRRRRNEKLIQIGIGMHTGPLIMGITGDENRLDATTISDTVNTASRLESLTKYYKVGIIISDASLVQIKKEQFHLRYLGLVQLKGKNEAIHIHECFDSDDNSDILNKQRTLPLFSMGIENCLNRSFETSISAFQTITEIHPADKTAAFFLNKAQQYLAQGVPDNWKGVVEMSAK